MGLGSLRLHRAQREALARVASLPVDLTAPGVVSVAGGLPPDAELERLTAPEKLVPEKPKGAPKK